MAWGAGGVNALCLERRYGLLILGGVASEGCDVATLGHQCLDNGPANAARSARYDRFLAFECHIQTLASCSVPALPLAIN